MGLFKKAGGAAALAGVAGAVSKRLADRQQQKSQSQGADQPGGPDGQAAPVAAPAAAPVTKAAPAFPVTNFIGYSSAFGVSFVLVLIGVALSVLTSFVALRRYMRV